MPTYEYRCPNGHLRDVRRPIDWRDLPLPCIQCGEVMTRQVAAPGFALRGAGFHANDYRKPAPKQFGEAD
jgi:putative FmdB family regulatory protein